MVHPLRIANGGRVVIMDRTGRTNAISSEWSAEEGLTWTPSSREVWFGARKGQPCVELHALSQSGKERLLAPLLANGIPQDLAADGRLLLARFMTAAVKMHGQRNSPPTVFLTPDAQSYIVTAERNLTDLFIAEGLQ